MFHRAVVLTLFATSISSAQNTKEMIQAVQRDLSIMQGDFKALKTSVDEKMGAITELLRQNTAAATELNKNLASLEARMDVRLTDQAKASGAPLAALGGKVDVMATDFVGVRESVTDMVSRLGKLEQKITTMSNDVKSMQAAPPPPSSGTSPAAGAAVTTIPADKLYADSYRDKMGGKLDLALQGFQEYMKAYATTEYAPNAQFWIGDIYYQQGELDKAVAAFDAVIDDFDENGKTPDAMLMKGKTLQRLSRKPEAVSAYRKLFGQYPRTEAGAKGCNELKAMSLPCVGEKSSPRKKK